MLSRAKVRARFEQRFTARRMAEDYLSVYRSLAGERGNLLRVVQLTARAGAGQAGVRQAAVRPG